MIRIASGFFMLTNNIYRLSVAGSLVGSLLFVGCSASTTNSTMTTNTSNLSAVVSDVSETPSNAVPLNSINPDIVAVPVESNYAVATATAGAITELNADPDVLLGGIDFNNAGGSLLFNHPGGIASDGQHFLLADRNNNRVLIWNDVPTQNEAPDLVLGQSNFTTNNPGIELHHMNWPIAVATDGERIVVADTNNARLLVWNSYPTQSGQPADFAIAGDLTANLTDAAGTVRWPWGVWTDGQRLLSTSTSLGQVLIWNNFPTSSTTQPDLVLNNDDLGTPRSVSTDGTHLIVDDHNAFTNQQGTFFWNTFPTTASAAYDFFLANPAAQTHTQPATGAVHGEQLYSVAFTEEGGLYGITNSGLYYWATIPQSDQAEPTLVIGSDTYDWLTGDGSSLVIADGHLYVSAANANMVLGYNTLPTTAVPPDFSIGSDDVESNTLLTNYFITNPVPATDGTSLLVTSDFDRRLSVWTQLPADSGAKPDYVYEQIEAWDNELYDGKFVAAGRSSVYLWDTVPLHGEEPTVLRDQIGSVQLLDIKGIAMDDRYFYLADQQANAIYVWEGIPTAQSEPVFMLTVQRPGRLSSDGQYLAVSAPEEHKTAVQLFAVEGLSASAEPVTIGNERSFNLPMQAILADGDLLIADTGFHRVLIWDDVASAIAGADADHTIGTQSLDPSIAPGHLFMPGALAWGGGHLWVGEYKFSGRLLGYTTQ